MNKVVHKRQAAQAAKESQLLQALEGAKLSATRSALSRISKGQAEFKPRQPLADPNTTSRSAAGVAPKAQTAESLLRAVAQSLQAWRSQLPPHLQPGLLALVHGGASIDVQTVAFCSPDSIRLSGSYQGRAYKLFAPASEIQFLCVPKMDAIAGTTASIVFDLGGEVFSA